jgi:superfamily I DNA/RNA helicase
MGNTLLDVAQQTVADLDVRASGVVIGAPGTGKTTALAARAAALLEGGLSTDQLLVLTPTRQTATSLRDRLALAAGRATGGPLARSLASFAFQLVRAAAVQRGDEPPLLLTAGDQDRIIAEILAGDDEDAAHGSDRWPDGLASHVRASRSFRTELRTLIAECAQLRIEPAELARLGAAYGRPAWEAAASFLADYRDIMGQMRAAHREAADLVAEAASILRNARPGGAAEPQLGPPALLRVALVDDAQELTRGGIELIRALRARGVAVMAFGDPDIGSGAFRGAGPELFAELCDLLDAVHVLDVPHRATRLLTSVTRLVTSAIGAAGRVDHRRAPMAGEGDDDALRTLVAPSPFEEVDRIARTLREWHVLDEVPWADMAVVAHDTRQVAALEVELAAREVPTRAAGVQRPLGREQVVRDLVEVVRLGLTAPLERDPDRLSAALLSPFGGLDAVGLRRLRARLRHAALREAQVPGALPARPARELLREALATPIELGLLGTREGGIAERLGVTLARLHDEAARGATIHDLLWTAWDRAREAGTGRRLADAWRDQAASTGILAAEVDHALDALVALFDAAKRAVERAPEDGPWPFVHRILDGDVPEDILAAPDRGQTVTLLTPAAALGTEFDAVVIAGLQDGVWPNVRLRGGLLDTWRLPDDIAAWRSGRTAPDAPAVLDRRRAALHDELRLLVRAVSRARTRLVVTAVDDDDLGASPLLSYFPPPDDDPDGPSVPQHPLTLRGLVAQHRRTLTTSSVVPAREHAAGQLGLLAGARVPGADPGEWYGILPPSSEAPLRDPARGPVHVSPSKLEGFAACELDWAVRALGGDTRSSSAGVGTILHAALEEVPSGALADLQALVDARWGELDFEAPWLSLKEHAWAGVLVGRLHAYLDRVAREGGRAIGAEARFRIGVDMDAPPGASPEVVEGEAAQGRRVALLSGSVDRVEVYPAGGGEELPADGDRPDGERVVIVDLKTGRSEDRVSDAKVVDDPQLASYQLALLEGRVPGADPVDNAGARLLVLSKTLKNTHYRLARQEPMTAERRVEFLRRIVDVAVGMASDSFDAHLDTHCRTDRFAVCGIHTVKAVSAS